MFVVHRWPLYSSMIVSNTNILTSAVLTYNLRYKLRLTAAGGRLTCYGFACVAPALFTGLMYDTVVQKTIMEGELIIWVWADLVCLSFVIREV